MRIKKQCLVCATEFETGGGGRPSHKVVYCSRSCAGKARATGLRREPQTRTCAVCGASFLVGGRGNKPLGTRYCSQRCAAAALKMPEIPKGARSGKIGRPPRNPKETRICKQCGTQWQQYPTDPNRRDYCSRRCYHESRIGKGNPIITPEQRPCAHCGEIFLVGGVGNRPKSAKFCSKTCAKQAYWDSSVAREMSEGERMWFAGLFDGEGCIAWPRRAILHSVRLDLASTNMALLERVLAVGGAGKVTLYNRKGNPRHSPCWGWHCYGDNARSILSQIYPWLIVKKEAAAVALGLVEATEPPWTQRTRSTRAAGGVA